MKKSKAIIAAMFALSVIFQAIYFSGGFQYMFAVGVDKSYHTYDVAVELIYVLIPILFIMFYISGSFLDLTNGYGKLLIVRNYSKTVLLLKKILAVSLTALIFAVYQFIVYSILSAGRTAVNSVLKAILLYYIVMLAVILFQCLLELYILPQIANIFIFIYSFISYFIAQVIPDEIIPKAVKIIIFPCLMFGMQNGAVGNEKQYYLYLLASIIINLVLILLSIRKFNKTDIF